MAIHLSYKFSSVKGIGILFYNFILNADCLFSSKIDTLNLYIIFLVDVFQSKKINVEPLLFGFNVDFIVQKVNKKYGVINKDNIWHIPPIFEKTIDPKNTKLESFAGCLYYGFWRFGLCQVREDGRWGFIDRSRQCNIEPANEELDWKLSL